MKTFVCIFVFFSVYCAYAEFAQFNGLRGNYIIRGEISSKSNTSSSIGKENVILVLDSDRERWLLDLGTQGKYWGFGPGNGPQSGKSYIVLPSVPDLAGKCGILPDFSYQNQIANYGRAFSTDKYDTTFFGVVADIGSCGYPVGVIMGMGKKDNKKFINRWDFQQEFPVRIPTGPTTFDDICVGVSSLLRFNERTVDFRSNRAPYFRMDPLCYNPSTIVDYCATAYYEGQQCSPFPVVPV